MERSGDTGGATTAKGGVRIEEPSRAERLIARRAAESRATVPDFELVSTVDASALVAAPAASGQRSLSVTALVVGACARGLREYPRANASYRDGHYELFSRVNVGVALASGDAVALPTISDADTKSALAIAAELDSLAARVRAGTITPPELAGATFTVTNLGILGVRSFSPPVVPPQAAILAVGAVREAPMVRGGDIVRGHEMTLTLVCDHRILYGTLAAEFLGRIRQLLERPRELLDR